MIRPRLVFRVFSPAPRALPSVGTADQDAPHYFTRDHSDPAGVYPELGHHPKIHGLSALLWNQMATLRIIDTARGATVPDPGNLTIQKGRRSCRHSTRKPHLSARQLRLVRCFAQCRYRSNVQQYQALFCLLTKRKPALVIRAVQLVLQESIGAIGVRTGAARQASPASGPKERPVAGRALIHHLARYQRPPQLAASLI